METKHLNVDQVIKILNVVIQQNKMPISLEKGPTKVGTQSIIYINTNKDTEKYADSLIRSFVKDDVVEFENKGVHYKSDVVFVLSVDAPTVEVGFSIEDVLENSNDSVVSNLSEEDSLEDMIKEYLDEDDMYPSEFKEGLVKEIIKNLPKSVVSRGSVSADEVKVTFLDLLAYAASEGIMRNHIYRAYLLANRKLDLGLDTSDDTLLKTVIDETTENEAYYNICVHYIVDKKQAEKQLEDLVATIATNIKPKESTLEKVQAFIYGNEKYSIKYQEELAEVIAKDLDESSLVAIPQHIHRTFLKLFAKSSIFYRQIRVLYDKIDAEYGGVDANYNKVNYDVQQNKEAYNLRILYMIDKERADKELEKIIKELVHVGSGSKEDEFDSLGDALPDREVVLNAARKGLSSDIRERKQKAILNVLKEHRGEFPQEVERDLASTLYSDSYEIQEETSVESIDYEIVKEAYDKYVGSLQIDLIPLVKQQYNLMVEDNKETITKTEKEQAVILARIFQDIIQSTDYHKLKVIAAISRSKAIAKIDYFISSYLKELTGGSKVQATETPAEKQKPSENKLKEEGIAYLVEQGVSENSAKVIVNIDGILSKRKETWIISIANYTRGKIEEAKDVAIINVGLNKSTSSNDKVRTLCAKYIAENFKGSENDVKAVEWYAELVTEGSNIQTGLERIFSKLKQENEETLVVDINTDIITTPTKEYVNQLDSVLGVYTQLEQEKYPNRVLKEMEETVLNNYKQSLYDSIDSSPQNVVAEYKRLFL